MENFINFSPSLFAVIFLKLTDINSMVLVALYHIINFSEQVKFVAYWQSSQ